MAAGVAACWLFATGATSALAAQRNILLIIADDYGMDSHPFYNSDARATFPPTPNIDALKENGVLFNNAYTYATCSPTRAAILTGRYGFRTGVVEVVGTGTTALTTNEYTLPEVLTANPSLGYGAASIGKWHLGSSATAPNAIGGWPHFSGSLGGGLPSYTAWSKVEDGTTTPNYSTYATTDNVNEAIEWIQAQGTGRWFLWLAFNAGHTPFHKPPNDLHSYDTLEDSQTAIDDDPRPYFEAMIEAMDTEIGRLLAAVDTDDTTIIFLGDNGTPGAVIQLPYRQQRAKGTLYEGGTHVPMIIAGPDIVNPNRSSDALVHCVDLYATILELAGADLGTVLPSVLTSDSRSLVPILMDEPFTPDVTAIYSENVPETMGGGLSGRMVRDGDFKLIRYEDDSSEFYDVATDPTELTNLLDGTLTTEQQMALDALEARLDAWQNKPELHSPNRSASEFTVDVGWFYGANLSLWKAADPGASSWIQVNDAVTEDTGFAIRLTDPAAEDAQSFYQVKHTPAVEP